MNMKRGRGLNGPWRLSYTLIITAVVVTPDQNRGTLAEEFNISCRYAGVFHVEKNRRYSLTRSEAIELCRALNSTLPTMEQMKTAHSLGFETCRYGYIEDKIVVPRINPYHLCAANSTGIYTLISNITERYDTYCYNASETREKACEPIIKLDASWADDESQIVIDNADGSRYTGGVRNTDPPPVTDDDNVGSGSTHERSITNPTTIRTHMPDAPYDKETTPDALSTDYSGSGRKEYHPTSTNNIAVLIDDKQTEDSTVISLITDGVPGKDRDFNKGQHPTSTNMSSHDDRTDDEDSTQDPLIPVISLGGEHSRDKEQHPPSTTMDPHRDAREETSTHHERNLFSDIWWWSNTDHKEQHPTTPTRDEDSEGYGVDDEDSTEDPLHSGILPGWDKNDDKEQHPPLTNVDSHGDPKRIETTQDPLLHNVYLGGDKDENKYPTNTSVDSMKPALFPAMERDHSSSNVTVNNEIGRNTYTPTGAKDEDPTQDPLLNGAYPGWSNKVDYSINATRDDMLPGVTPSRENEHSATDNQPGWDSEDKYHTDTSRDYVLPGLIPPNENEYESYTAVVSSNGATLEDSTQDPLLHSVHPKWGNEDKYLTNTSGDDDLPGIIPPSETEHKNESSHTAVVSNDGAKHEDSTKDPLTTGIQPGRDNEDKYPPNNTRDNMIPGVFYDLESGQGREPASTATSFTVINRDGRRGQPGRITTPKIAPQPRSAQIPEWLIIVASLLALALILAVCIAVNSRRRCGQKRKLVINNGKGSVSDTKMGGLNGEASKSQEMVHLVHKEQPDNQKGSCDEFLTTDETQNQKEADMKTGM
ncbi:CD44 antigen isoform X2 [Emydura macquarii macquarii]|uniref:CD44 antigen isoform X2 n=1 Tax=Emydura macquarii macquarii TaxID=1129001 RepID=UPI00352B8C43